MDNHEEENKPAVAQSRAEGANSNGGLGTPKPDTEVSDIVRDWLKLNGFDGLCHGESECGCHLDDFLICGGDSGAFPQCRPAYKFKKEGYDWWMSTDKHWQESENDDA